MRIRGASGRDVPIIDKLFKESNFKLDIKHLEMMLVAEDEDGVIIGVCSLVKILECSFLTTDRVRQREKTEAFAEVVRVGAAEANRLGYDVVHAFTENKQVERTLRKHFDFQDPKGKVLIKFTG